MMSKVTESSTAYVVGQPETTESILVATLDLPPKYAWFNELNAEERLRFFAGLWEVLTTMKNLSLPNGRQRSRMAAVNEFTRGWQATVELEASPETRISFERGREDIEHGRLASYEEVFNDV
jgi:hypothetical protein